jgi:predicted amidohydrolase YtcJ
MTQWNAIATFTENDLGTLELGKRADFTVVNLDLLKASDGELLKAKVVGTFLDGERLDK